MGDADHDLIENVIVGDFHSSDDERMSGISDQKDNQMDIKNVPRVTQMADMHMAEASDDEMPSLAL